MKKFKRNFYLKLIDLFGKSSEEFSPHGIKIHIPRNTDIDIRYLLARKRPYEREEALFVKEYIEYGTDVIELGGCMGIVSALIRDRIGPDAQHIIIEANSELAKICANNAKTNVIVAAIDYSGAEKVKFSIGDNAHVGHLAKEDEQGIDVPTTTLTKIVSESQIKSFAFVCDIEGAEIALFTHENKIFDLVSTIILETHPAIYEDKNDLQELMGRIKNLGFLQKQKLNNVFCFQRK